MEMAELCKLREKYYRNHYHDLFVSISRSHGITLTKFICSHESYCSVAGIMCGTENKT